jgi:Aerotolerance regulator N-terminal
MIEWLQPLLLAGAAAASVPLIVHLLQRRKLRRVQWGAMRFLQDVLARRRRRLLLEELLLLALRMLILGVIAAAMARPAWRSKVAEGAERQGGVAAVLLVDDGLSSAAGRAQPALEAVKRLGAAYIDSLAPGDEVSVIPLSSLGGPAPADPDFDLDGVRRRIAALQPSHAATDVPALLDAGMEQLKRHINPSAELVVLTDGRSDGWRRGDRARWERQRQRLRGSADASAGSRRRPRVVVLAAEPEPAPNVSVDDVSMDRTLVTAGRAAGVRVRVGNHGDAATAVAVKLAVNGAPAGEAKLEIGPRASGETLFTQTFPAAGAYAVEASLVGNHDALPGDDARAAAVEVEPPLPVLLVDGNGGAGYSSGLGFLQTALDPEGDGSGPFRVSRITAAQWTPAMLASNRVVVVADVRALEPSLTDALERFVLAGGGLLVGLGPNSDPGFLNTHWGREGEGLLPCPVTAAASPAQPALPSAPGGAHPLYAGFGARQDEAWKEARVRRYFQLSPARSSLPDFEPLLNLDNGDVLLAERRRGLGLCALWTSSLNADWNELPAQAAYVALMRSLVGRLGSYVVPSRNIVAGGRLVEPRAGLEDEPFTSNDPAGAPLALEWGVFEGRGALVSPRLDAPGVYGVRFKNGTLLRYAVACDPAESALDSLKEADVADALEGSAVLLRRPESVRPALEPGRRHSVELWRWLVAGALGLLFLEAWLAKRGSGAARDAAAGPFGFGAEGAA